jgi:hypothetical protein
MIVTCRESIHNKSSKLTRAENAMSAPQDHASTSWEQTERQLQRELQPKPRHDIRRSLFWILLPAVIFLALWVANLKLSREPGIYIQLINESGQILKDLHVNLTWGEYSQSELSKERRKDWWTPHVAVLQRIGNTGSKTDNLKVTWLDGTGVRRQHLAPELYMGWHAEKLIITFHANGTVTIKQEGLSLF